MGSKGLLGLKISGVKNVRLRGKVSISDLVELTDVGSGVCGAKELYHFSQQSPYQIGFCMNMLHAMAVDFSEVEIEEGASLSIDGLHSRTGLAFGLSLWFDTQM